MTDRPTATVETLAELQSRIARACLEGCPRCLFGEAFGAAVLCRVRSPERDTISAQDDFPLRHPTDYCGEWQPCAPKEAPHD